MITVVTSITGGKDGLIDDQVKGNADFYAYLDRPFSSNTWSIGKAYDRFHDARRNSRIHKILIHEYHDSEYSIWIDGNIKLLVSPEEIIERYLKDHDIAVFQHPNRDCIYDEAIVCAERGLEKKDELVDQCVNYNLRGYAPHKGLAECGIIMRRHTPEVRALNNEWWAQYTRYSKRDQISFMYAVDAVGIRVNLIKGFFLITKEGKKERYIKTDGSFEIFPHIIPNTPGT